VFADAKRARTCQRRDDHHRTSAARRKRTGARGVYLHNNVVAHWRRYRRRSYIKTRKGGGGGKKYTDRYYIRAPIGPDTTRVSELFAFLRPGGGGSVRAWPVANDSFRFRFLGLDDVGKIKIRRRRSVFFPPLFAETRARTERARTNVILSFYDRGQTGTRRGTVTERNGEKKKMLKSNLIALSLSLSLCGHKCCRNGFARFII